MKTQFEVGAKVQPKFCGPYRVVGSRGNDRYEVVRVGGTGVGRTTTAADYMKPWVANEVVDPDGEVHLSEDDEDSG